MLYSSEYPSISVIVPSFNQGQFIEDTLVSIFSQQYPNLEVLVLDGGSTDNTVEILEKYSDRITYWHSKPDQGQADAINQGFAMSTGEVICWLNSDDMYLPGTLLDIGRRFQGRTDQPHLIYGNTILLYQDGEEHKAVNSQLGEPFDAFQLTHYDFIPQASSFWTRKLWQQVGELNLKYSFVLDWDWFIRASQVTSFDYIPKFYSLYRIHEAHKTGVGGEKRRQEIMEIVEIYSSSYWTDLYAIVSEHYAAIRSKSQFLKRWRVPRWQAVLLLLIPKLRAALQTPQHLFKILEMYG